MRFFVVILLFAFILSVSAAPFTSHQSISKRSFQTLQSALDDWLNPIIKVLQLPKLLTDRLNEIYKVRLTNGFMILGLSNAVKVLRNGVEVIVLLEVLGIGRLLLRNMDLDIRVQWESVPSCIWRVMSQVCKCT